MSTTENEYSPGSWLCLSTRHACALIDLPIASPLVARCWRHLAETDGDPVTGLLAILGSTDLAALPDFAFCWVGENDLRVAVRGRATVELALQDGAPAIDAGRHPTWYDALVARSPGVVHLRGGESSDVVLPLAAGVTSASRISITVEAAAGAVAPTPVRPSSSTPVAPTYGAAAIVPVPGGDDSAGVPEGAPTTGATVADATDATDAAPDSATGGSPDDVPEADVYGDLIGATEDRARMLARLQASLESEAPDTESPGTSGAGDAAEPTADPRADRRPTSADDTEGRPPEAGPHQTAIWESEEDRSAPPGVPGLPTGLPGGLPSPSRPAAHDGPRAAAPATPAGGTPARVLIDGAPWARRGATSPAPSRDEGQGEARPMATTTPPLAPPPGGLGTDPGLSSPSLAPGPDPASDTASDLETHSDTVPDPDPDPGELTSQRAHLHSSMNGESVQLLGVLCPEGHANAPHAANCRVCGRPVEADDPRLVERPTLGRLLLPNGEHIELERDVVLGRLPAATEGAADRPHLVKVSESPEVSRSHVRIRLDGWQVLLRDLDTTNYTWLTLPGSDQLRLSPHEEYALEPGSVIDLAEEVVIVFEMGS